MNKKQKTNINKYLISIVLLEDGVLLSKIFDGTNNFIVKAKDEEEAIKKCLQQDEDEIFKLIFEAMLNDNYFAYDKNIEDLKKSLFSKYHKDEYDDYIINNIKEMIKLFQIYLEERRMINITDIENIQVFE